jgi:hypothetical protein
MRPGYRTSFGRDCAGPDEVYDYIVLYGEPGVFPHETLVHDPDSGRSETAYVRSFRAEHRGELLQIHYRHRDDSADRQLLITPAGDSWIQMGVSEGPWMRTRACHRKYLQLYRTLAEDRPEFDTASFGRLFATELRAIGLTDAQEIEVARAATRALRGSNPPKTVGTMDANGHSGQRGQPGA